MDKAEKPTSTHRFSRQRTAERESAGVLSMAVFDTLRVRPSLRRVAALSQAAAVARRAIDGVGYTPSTRRIDIYIIS